MMRMFAKLRSDEGGASIIELALAAPIMATLVLGVTDIANACSMKIRLEQAAQRAIEKVEQQGRSTNDYSGLSSIASAEATAYGYNNSTVTVTYSLECNGSTNTSTTGNAINASCSTGQTYSRYVTVAISNTYTPIFGTTFFSTHNSDGTVTLSGYAGMRVQ
jgi:Flp pilus assembly protein TadG